MESGSWSGSWSGFGTGVGGPTAAERHTILSTSSIAVVSVVVDPSHLQQQQMNHGTKNKQTQNPISNPAVGLDPAAGTEGQCAIYLSCKLNTNASI